MALCVRLPCGTSHCYWQKAETTTQWCLTVSYVTSDCLTTYLNHPLAVNISNTMLHCFSEANDMQLFDQSRAYLKGQFTIKSKIHIFPLSCSAGYLSRLLWCDFQSFRDIVCRDVCLLWNVMELDRLVVLKVPKNTVKENLKQQCLFPEFSTCLPKINHRLCDEQFLYRYSRMSG